MPQSVQLSWLRGRGGGRGRRGQEQSFLLLISYHKFLSSTPELRSVVSEARCCPWLLTGLYSYLAVVLPLYEGAQWSPREKNTALPKGKTGLSIRELSREDLKG